MSFCSGKEPLNSSRKLFWSLPRRGPADSSGQLPDQSSRNIKLPPPWRWCRSAIMYCAAWGALTLGLACATQPGAPPANIPLYEPVDATLFDDTLSPAALGEETTEPFVDPKIAERVRRADSVVPVKVVTVTLDRVNGQRCYQLELRPTGRSLAGGTAQKLLLRMVESSPAFALIRGGDTALVGKPLIVFFRRYDHGGTETIHWRAEPDSLDVRSAVRQAQADRLPPNPAPPRPELASQRGIVTVPALASPVPAHPGPAPSDHRAILER